MENPSSSGVNYIVIFILPAIAAIGAFAAAIFTYFAARVSAKANRGQTLLACLDKYISIMKDRRYAIDKKDAFLAREFYRELFDLHWSEFHLWQEGAIYNHVMKAWLAVRKRNFENEKISVRSAEGAIYDITYKEEWRASISRNYFENYDPFIYFMNIAHSSDVNNIKELKRNSRKRIK